MRPLVVGSRCTTPEETCPPRSSLWPRRLISRSSTERRGLRLCLCSNLQGAGIKIRNICVYLMIGRVSAGQRMRRRCSRCYPHAEHTWTLQKFKRPSRKSKLFNISFRVAMSQWTPQRHRTLFIFFRRSIEKKKRKNETRSANDKIENREQTNKPNRTETILLYRDYCTTAIK